MAEATAVDTRTAARDTLPGLIEPSMRSRPKKTALKSRGEGAERSISYGELDGLVAALGASLAARGLKPGGRVALLAENGAEWAITYLAVTAAGAAIVPLDTQLRENEIRNLVLHSESSFLVVSRSLADAFSGDIELPGVRVISIGAGAARNGYPFEDALAEGARLIAAGDRRFHERRAAVRPDDIAAICYTSGTMGQPKGVVLLHRNIASDVESCAGRIPFNGNDVFLCILPLFHTYATTTNLLAPLSVGASVFFGRSLKSRDIRDDIAREGVTVLLGVPLLFERMATTIEKRLGEMPAPRRILVKAANAVVSTAGRLIGTDLARPAFRAQRAARGLGTIRFCVSGAAALKAETERTLSRLGIPVLQGYGMTEAAPVISANPLDRPRRGTVGPPLPGIEIRIEEPDGDGIGEILVRGPNVMAGYLKNPAATQEVLREGWLHTGDLGRLGADGYLTFIGRKKSVIVTAGGKNVYPDEIETRLAASPYILESLVLPVRDRRGNEQVGAIVVPDYESFSRLADSRGGMNEDEIAAVIAAEIRSVCADLPEHKRVREWRLRPSEFPKTSTRKIKRHLVKWPEA